MYQVMVQYYMHCIYNTIPYIYIYVYNKYKEGLTVWFITAHTCIQSSIAHSTFTQIWPEKWLLRDRRIGATTTTQKKSKERERADRGNSVVSLLWIIVNHWCCSERCAACVSVCLCVCLAANSSTITDMENIPNKTEYSMRTNRQTNGQEPCHLYISQLYCAKL